MRKLTPSPLEQVRRARTLNQYQLADLVGISQQHLSKIERGKAEATKLIRLRLAAVLGVAEAELFPISLDTVER